MDKILVEVLCAATGKKYDFLLPGQMRVRTALRKIMEQIRRFEENEELFPGEKNCFLAEKDHKEILNEDFTLEQAGVLGGNRLILL